MQRYLLFDSGCVTCTGLASKVEQETDGWVVARSLRDPQMMKLLDQARPGWKWEPTLLEHEGTDIRVFTGAALRAKMVVTLGPIKAIRIAWVATQMLGRREVNQSRRTLLKQGAALIGGALLLPRLETGVAAATPTTSVSSPQFAFYVDQSGNIKGQGSATTAEIQTFLAAAKGSPNYQKFAKAVGANTSIGTQATIWSTGDTVHVTIPVIENGNPSDSGFAGLVDRKTGVVLATLGRTVTHSSVGYRFQTELDGKPVSDVVIDEAGTVVSGTTTDARGVVANVSHQDYRTQGQMIFDNYRGQLVRSFSTSSGAATSKGVHPNFGVDFGCFSNCLNNSGVPFAVITFISIICAAACIGTVGAGCYACILALDVGFNGIIGHCLGSCTY